MPKKFNFSLETILKYRKNLQNNKVLKLHNTKIELESEQRKLSDIEKIKNTTLQKGRTGNRKKLNLLDQKIFFAYVDQINKNIDNQNQIVEVSKNKVIEATEDLSEETKRKKILEKLKEKHLDKFKIDLRRKEEKDNSEIATRKYYLKQ